MSAINQQIYSHLPFSPKIRKSHSGTLRLLCGKKNITSISWCTKNVSGGPILVRALAVYLCKPVYIWDVAANGLSLCTTLLLHNLHNAEWGNIRNGNCSTLNFTLWSSVTSFVDHRVPTVIIPFHPGAGQFAHFLIGRRLTKDTLRGPTNNFLYNRKRIRYSHTTYKIRKPAFRDPIHIF